MQDTHGAPAPPPVPLCDRLARYVRKEGPVHRRTYPVQAGTMPAQELETSDGVRWILIEIVPVATVTDLRPVTTQRLATAIRAKHRRNDGFRRLLRDVFAADHDADHDTDDAPDREAA